MSSSYDEARLAAYYEVCNSDCDSADTPLEMLGYNPEYTITTDDDATKKANERLNMMQSEYADFYNQPWYYTPTKEFLDENFKCNSCGTAPNSDLIQIFMNCIYTGDYTDLIEYKWYWGKNQYATKNDDLDEKEALRKKIENDTKKLVKREKAIRAQKILAKEKELSADKPNDTRNNKKEIKKSKKQGTGLIKKEVKIKEKSETLKKPIVVEKEGASSKTQLKSKIKPRRNLKTKLSDNNLEIFSAKKKKVKKISVEPKVKIDEVVLPMINNVDVKSINKIKEDIVTSIVEDSVSGGEIKLTEINKEDKSKLRSVYCCSNCDAKFTSRNGFNYHQKFVHSEDKMNVVKPYACPFEDCSKKYKNKNGLYYHLVHHHSGDSNDIDTLYSNTVGVKKM